MKNSGGGVVKTFSHHSARATLRTHHSGINEVSYSGALCCKGLAAIRQEILATRSPMSVVRFDQCALLMIAFSPVTASVFVGNMYTAAVVANEAQYAICCDFARQTALFGLKRVVFHASQLAQAREFAQDHAGR